MAYLKTYSIWSGSTEVAVGGKTIARRSKRLEI